MSTNLLRIGSLHYTFRYSINDTSAYLTNRKEYMQKRLRNWDIPSCFAIQPQRDHIRLRHVILHNVIAKGDTCVVRVGVNRKTGDPIACKTIQCSHDNIKAVLNEIKIASLITTHAFSGLVPLLNSSCGHGNKLPCSQIGVEDMHLVMPYAPFTFETAPWQDMQPSLKLALFREALEGLKNLHAAGIMHRDINPSNLLVFSLRPAAAAISDFGMAKTGFQSANKSLKLLAYQAPEVATQETYTNSIDIFSLALSILATFEGCIWSGPLSDRQRHSTMLNHLARLATRMPDGLATLLSAMLSWDPSHRPSAEGVLADAVWRQITDSDSGSTSDRHSREKSSSIQWPGDDGLPSLGLNKEDGSDRMLRRPIPNTPPRSLSPDSNTSGADDMTQRMNRSQAPPPSSIADDGVSSTAKVSDWDDTMSEQMNRSQAPPPSSIADDDVSSTAKVSGSNNMSEQMNRSQAPSPLSTANDTNSAYYD
ncbi:kinase-like domain-containing protein [Trichoderma austrokoningii]